MASLTAESDSDDEVPQLIPSSVAPAQVNRLEGNVKAVPVTILTGFCVSSFILTFLFFQENLKLVCMFVNFIFYLCTGILSLSSLFFKSFFKRLPWVWKDHVAEQNASKWSPYRRG
jgi:hypothetical protein